MVSKLSRLQNDFRKVAQDGKITAAEADGLIRRVRADKLTESEAKAFKKEAARLKDSFAPDAAAKIEAFIKAMPKYEVLDSVGADLGPLKDPAVLKADQGRLQPELVKGGELFRNGVQGTDPEQNYIGDCYLMAAMSAVAKASPKAIEDAFKQNADGTYTVRLYDRKGGKLVPHEVKIDASLPRNGWYGYYYARSHDPKELWPALLEKAFAAKAGSYGKIEAGVPSEALEAITGKPSSELDLRARGMTPDKAFQAIADAAKAGKPITAATLGESSNAKYKDLNIYADHTYTVWGTSVEKGVKYVHLRNPWGSSEPEGNGKDDGVFKLPLAQFVSLFSGVAISG